MAHIRDQAHQELTAWLRHNGYRYRIDEDHRQSYFYTHQGNSVCIRPLGNGFTAHLKQPFGFVHSFCFQRGLYLLARDVHYFVESENYIESCGSCGMQVHIALVCPYCQKERHILRKTIIPAAITWMLAAGKVLLPELNSLILDKLCNLITQPSHHKIQPWHQRIYLFLLNWLLANKHIRIDVNAPNPSDAYRAMYTYNYYYVAISVHLGHYHARFIADDIKHCAPAQVSVPRGLFLLSGSASLTIMHRNGVSCASCGLPSSEQEGCQFCLTAQSELRTKTMPVTIIWLLSHHLSYDIRVTILGLLCALTVRIL